MNAPDSPTPDDPRFSPPDPPLSQPAPADVRAGPAPGTGYDDGLPVEPLEGAPDIRVLPQARAPRPPHPGFWWAVLWTLGYIIVTQVPAALIAVIILMSMLGDRPDLMQRLQDPNLSKSREYIQAMGPALFVAQILGIAGSWLAIRLVIGRNWPRVLGLRLPGLAHTVLAIIGLPALMTTSVCVSVAVKRGFEHMFGTGDPFGLDEMMRMFGDWPIHFAVVAIGVGPALAEELFCRGFLGRGLVGRFGAWWGVILTSLFFGIMHVEPRQAIYATLIGVMLHAAYLWTRSLWVPILLHFLNNTISVIALHWRDLDRLDVAVDRAPWHVLGIISAGAVALLVGVGWALYTSRARLVSPTGAGHWEPPYPSVAHPPPETATRVIHPAPSGGAWLGVLTGALGFAGCIWLAVRMYR